MNSSLISRYLDLFILAYFLSFFFIFLFAASDNSSVLLCLQDFQVAAMEKFVEGASVPIVTLFTKEPNHQPFVMKFFNSPNAKVLLFSHIKIYSKKLLIFSKSKNKSHRKY